MSRISTDLFGGWTYDLNRSDSSSPSPSPGGGGDRTFAPPTTVLPTVTISAPRFTAPAPMPSQPLAPSPSLGQSFARGVRSLLSRLRLNPLLLLFVPGNMGPDGTGNRLPTELPTPGTPELLPELEPIIITPQRRVPPPRTPTGPDVGNDPIMPPNWDDLSDPGGKRFGEPEDPFSRPGVPDTPIYLPRDRPEPQSPSDPGELPNPDGPLALPFVMPDTRSTPRPSTRPDAYPVLPDAFGFPDPVPFRSPRARPDPVARPRVGARPGGRPATPLPVETPFFVGDFAPQPDYRPTPRAPGGTSRPDFFTDPAPDLTTDPWGDVDRPTSDDQCQCDKPKKNHKPKKKRTTCMQGTYTQREKGISYSPKRMVPCAGKAPKETKSKSPKKPRRRKPKSIGDLARDIFFPT